MALRARQRTSRIRQTGVSKAPPTADTTTTLTARRHTATGATCLAATSTITISDATAATISHKTEMDTSIRPTTRTMAHLRPSVRRRQRRTITGARTRMITVAAATVPKRGVRIRTRHRRRRRTEILPCPGRTRELLRDTTRVTDHRLRIIRTAAVRRPTSRPTSSLFDRKNDHRY